MFGSWRRLIVTRLHAEGVAVEDAEDLATLALCTYEGSITLARAWRDARPLRQAGTQIAALLAAAAPGLAAAAPGVPASRHPATHGAPSSAAAEEARRARRGGDPDATGTPGAPSTE